MGENARAALNTRALAEISLIVTKMKGQPLTALGLAGAGDLFLTCSSHKSRNFEFGYLFAKNKNPQSLITHLGTVEGYQTTFAAAKIARKRKIRMPLLFMAEKILQNKLSFEKAFENLMRRKTRMETEL
jgi:glycerol-3-phosphate dehydrogenase (NAD(P)+)